MKRKQELLEKLNKEYKSIYSFKVKRNESIHDVVNSPVNQVNLPDGYCKIVLYNPKDYSLVFGKKERTTGNNPGGQNIFSFFANVGSRNYPKWQQLQEEMVERSIPEIEVVVFWREL